MVVGHFFVIDNLGRIAGKLHTSGKGQRPSGKPDQLRQTCCHIRSQVTAVRPRIGAELLFIEVLQIVQGLLGCEPQQPVGVPLEGGQVIEAGGFSDLSLRSTFFTVAAASWQAVFSCWAVPLSAMRSPETEKPGSSSVTV